MTLDNALPRPMISCNKVTFSYCVRLGYLKRRRVVALQDIDVELYEGEALGVIGVNGAGKSTLLSLMAGIYAPDSGTINNYGNSVSMLALQAGFIPYLNGRDNVMLSGLTLGLRQDEIKERMEDIRAFADIGEYFDRPITSYSSGMRARLGFAIGFQMNPDVLLIDEVFGVGDTAFQDKSSKLMRAKIRSNKSVVMVAHNAALIRRLCDRAILLAGGKLIAYGDPADVIKVYNTEYVKLGGKKA